MRHPLTLLTGEVPAVRLEPGRTCLILQDVHKPLADAGGGWLARRAREKVLMREFDEYVDTLEIISDNFRALAEACRQSGIEVAYVSLGKLSDQSLSPFQEATGWVWDSGGLDWGFPRGWHPSEGDRLFIKQGWGALSSPEFGIYVEERDIGSVIVAGTMYDYGIRHTCFELADMGIPSLVASDAVVALTHAGQGHTSGNLAHGLTKLRSTAEILDLLEVMRGDGYVLV